jgi:hypothetical protein
VSRYDSSAGFLALDGKTVRGAHIPSTTSTTDSSSDAVTSGYRQPHLVSVLDQGSGVVLGQVEVKGSEVAAFTTLLDELDLTDVLVTATRVCRAATSTTCPPTGSAS